MLRPCQVEQVRRHFEGSFFRHHAEQSRCAPHCHHYALSAMFGGAQSSACDPDQHLDANGQEPQKMPDYLVGFPL